MTHDTIAALATARGTAALAIVRLSGPEAIRIADGLFHTPGVLAQLETRRCAVGHLMDGGEVLDQIVATVFRAPHSYTGEDLVEITCHGGWVVPRRVLDLLLRHGARAAGPGEFTLRAFLQGKIDLSQAEATAALIAAHSTAAARAAVRVLGGGLRDRLATVLARLTEALARIEAAIDFAEDGAPDAVVAVAPGDRGADAGGVRQENLGILLAEVQAQLDSLLAGAEGSRLLEEGLAVVIAGRPNAGKSSLFNALLARERAIVSSEPGTTRDFLEAWVEWAGLPIVLVDTAGLRDGQRAQEIEGVRRAREMLASAAQVILVVDVETTAPTELEARLAELPVERARVTVALHKWDLPARERWERGRPDRHDIGADTDGGAPHDAPRLVPSSALGDPGVDGLRAVVGQALAAGLGDLSAALLVSGRQRQLAGRSAAQLREARRLLETGAGGELVAFELRGAMDRLGELLGKRVGPLVLEEIFSRFCIGK